MLILAHLGAILASPKTPEIVSNEQNKGGPRSRLACFGDSARVSKGFDGFVISALYLVVSGILKSLYGL